MEATAATRCVLYLRISLDSTGEHLAVARQRQDCTKIAADRGWAIVDEYVDNSIGAYSRTKIRPEYNRMVEDYRAGKFDALVCWDLDRLTRQPAQLEHWIEWAETRGLLLVTANGEADLTNDNGILFAGIKANVARAESMRKAARQRRALQQRAESGRPPLGVRLTGYTTDGKVIKAEAAIVKAIFKRFYEGDSLRAVAAWLNGRPVPTRHGAPWNPSSVRTILTNPRYAGRSYYNRKANKLAGPMVPGTWKPLVDEWLFEAVEVMLADPRRLKQVGTDRKHLGSGLYLCGICGTPLRAHRGSQALPRYRCPRGGHVTRSAGPVDELVITLACMYIATPRAHLLFEPETDAARQAAKTIKRLRISLRKAELDYDNDLIDGIRYKAKRDKITAELDAAEAALSPSPGGADIARRLAAEGRDAAGVRRGFDMLPLGGQRAMIGGLMTVRLMKAPRGKHFDPASVEIEWR